MPACRRGPANQRRNCALRTGHRFEFPLILSPRTTLFPVDLPESRELTCGAMAIRFQCPACAQPIEVDDEWASKAVACPYCRKTVTAPAESTFEHVDAASVPTASTLSPAGIGRGDVDDLIGSPPRGRLAANRLATAALIIALISFVMLGVYVIIIMKHPGAMARLNEGFTNARSFTEKMEVYNEFLQEQGGVPGWLLTASLCVMAGALCWITAVVCGLIAARRAHHRRRALTALFLTGMMPVLFCCGGL